MVTTKGNDARRCRIHSALPSACPAFRVRQDPALRFPGESLPEKGFAAGTDAVAEWGATRDFTHRGATKRGRPQVPGMRRGKAVCARLASAKPRNNSSVGSQFLLKTQERRSLQGDVVFTANPQLPPAVPTKCVPMNDKLTATSRSLDHWLIIRVNLQPDVSWAVVNAPDAQAPKPNNPRTVQSR